MTTIEIRAEWRRFLIIATALLFAVWNGTALGQSDIVFMTSDISPNLASRLFRFDGGTESFDVGRAAETQMDFTASRFLMAMSWSLIIYPTVSSDSLPAARFSVRSL